MNELEKLLSDKEPGTPNVAVTDSPVLVKKSNMVVLKGNTLAAQELTIAAASIGSPLFRSASDFIPDITKPKA